MAKKDDQEPTARDIQIYTAGAVPLPPNYPEIGIVTETKMDMGDDVLGIEHRVSPLKVKRYLVRRKDVIAIRLVVDGTDHWLLGERAQKVGLTPSKNGRIHGIVFVRESVGVVVTVQIERSVTAGEIDEEVICEKDGYCEPCKY